MAKRSSEFDEYALKGIRAEIERLQALEKQLTAGRKGGQASSGRGGVIAGSGFQGGGGWSASVEVPQRRKRKLSAAGRKAISDAAKARWAKVKAEKGGEMSGGKQKGGKKR